MMDLNDILTEYKAVFSTCPLLAGLAPESLGEVLAALHGKVKMYDKGEMIIAAGEPFRATGLVLDGKTEASYTNNQFDKLTMNVFGPGQLFGEALALRKVPYSPVQVQAITDCVVLFLDVSVLLDASAGSGSQTPEWRIPLMANLMLRLTDQNIFSNLKVRILSQKALRDRIFLYLSSLPPDANGMRHVPFSQTALAEFLNVNRSALSRELGRMQDEGLLRINGNGFQLL